MSTFATTRGSVTSESGAEAPRSYRARHSAVLAGSPRARNRPSVRVTAAARGTESQRRETIGIERGSKSRGRGVRAGGAGFGGARGDGRVEGNFGTRDGRTGRGPTGAHRARRARRPSRRRREERRHRSVCTRPARTRRTPASRASTEGGATRRGGCRFRDDATKRSSVAREDRASRAGIDRARRTKGNARTRECARGSSDADAREKTRRAARARQGLATPPASARLGNRGEERPTNANSHRFL